MTSGIAMGLIALFGFLVLFRELVTGSLAFSATAVLNATIAPQGNASTSTVPNIPTTVNSISNESLTFGIASGNCDTYVCQDRTLTSSSTETFDLGNQVSGTVLTDVAGATAPMVKVKFIMIYVVSGGDTGGLTIGGATDPFLCGMGGTTPTKTVYPGGPAFLYGEPTVGSTTSSTHTNLKIANTSSVSITYRIVVAGTSA